MVELAKKVAPISSITSTSKHSNSPVDAIRSRRSQELIIGLCGAIGSGVKSLNTVLQTHLETYGYRVKLVSLSELIRHYSKPSKNPFDDPADTSTFQPSQSELPSSNAFSSENLTGFSRYQYLQDAGDKMRSNHGPSVLAELAIRDILTWREENYGQGSEETTKITDKVAYIIDQLKHPKEVEMFKEVYRNNFYLIGLLRTEAERKHYLKNEGISDQDISNLIIRDRKSANIYGQQVQDTLHKSDYFISDIDSTSQLKKSVTRFIELVHGLNNLTPTRDEVGIYAAYSASLRSACLSRQVGASIADDEGSILSTGCNDVPQYRGGLYNSESTQDMRCFNHGGVCHNDKHKNKLKSEIEKILNDNNILDSKKIAEKIIKETKAKSLIEYSRAIHAEMDAIMALARATNNSSLGKTLYCTTYPCHVCARHIVAAGIRRVVYIEPYEKSLAMELHSDAICHLESRDINKVLFENFEGVSPTRYAKFFVYDRKRKDESGMLIVYSAKDSGHVDHQHLDSYNDYEVKVVKMLGSRIPVN